MADQMTRSRIEQRALLRAERVPEGATIVVRGGSDTRDKLRRHAERTARAWSLDGQPLLGVSVFAVLDVLLEDLLRQRFANFRTIYLPWRLGSPSTASSPATRKPPPCARSSILLPPETESSSISSHCPDSSRTIKLSCDDP